MVKRTSWFYAIPTGAEGSEIMTDTVVSFADMAFRLRGQRVAPDTRCEHKHLTLDDNGEIVTCEDCQKQVSSFWALRRMASMWGNHAQQVRRAVEKVHEDQRTTFHLRAAKVVERAWRHRKTVPLCPHCKAGILPEDGFGSSSMSRAIELKRRADREPVG